ncbi:MAG TPA: C4-type zinc ribbon domain-containing protein [Verrucomicrobiae bacterium]|nr:C4-type zinc ribbon domain-containing protein [Verrucomicrobiae bacterium]
MNALLQNLVTLQSLEFEETTEKNAGANIAELRAKIPPQILGHYDRLVARGKKGIAAVRHQTCTGCHMKVTLGVVLTLQRDEDVQLCDNCGRYLYLDETPDTAESPKKKRGRKKSAELIPA